MTCRSCGTTIADKAIVCYKCGTPTAEVHQPVARDSARRRFPVIVAIAVVIVALILSKILWP